MGVIGGNVTWARSSSAESETLAPERRSLCRAPSPSRPSTWVVDGDDEERRRRSWHVAPHYRAYLLQKRPRLAVLAARRQDEGSHQLATALALLPPRQYGGPAPYAGAIYPIETQQLVACRGEPTQMQSARPILSAVGASAQQIRLQEVGLLLQAMPCWTDPKHNMYVAKRAILNVQWSDAYNVTASEPA